MSSQACALCTIQRSSRTSHQPWVDVPLQPQQTRDLPLFDGHFDIIARSAQRKRVGVGLDDVDSDVDLLERVYKGSGERGLYKRGCMEESPRWLGES